VIAISVPIDLVGVPVRDGDLIGADYDGCVVVPRAIERALEKVSAENTMRVVLRRGVSIRPLFKEYGITPTLTLLCAWFCGSAVHANAEPRNRRTGQCIRSIQIWYYVVARAP
jgi:hypothetical protein